MSADKAPTTHLEANTIILPPRGTTDMIMAMDVDSPSLPSYRNLKRGRESRGHSRSSSWHSGEDELPLTGERPHSSSGVSRSVSLSDKHSASHEDSSLGSRFNDEARSHAAFRMFKESLKRTSERYGPFLPTDDGSPLLAHRLRRMWDDLSTEQRNHWFQAAYEVENDHHGDSRIPYSIGTESQPYSPVSASASTTRFPVGMDGMPRQYSNANTPDLRSPASFLDDEAGSSLRSRSQSPGEDHPSTSHIPRPANAWILFRSTMSKSRRPDGAVYSPPEISVLWKELSQQERDFWFERAKAVKQEHEAANPGYRYQPKRNKSRRTLNSSSPSGLQASTRPPTSTASSFSASWTQK
ncbi:SubName: Full=Uncharacterized protein {ECO:0000313/EMBL:CCA66554.1} [Serendipita indica DSM 11827]|uniref:HMG box domain-containing protein n=1 Tax=Serendipita indica (strain DSM 11827) TaxID=1109443 RepID=G4T5K3_SERID|nr:SubName: Full=Uncharacterized protein {ECO:0000313/EMBL:CCA66554.1} [Serendipita indica DSM 11827]CCA66554.1 hypothetical protein PIIN_00238 [Serendipita indica DSM 11827]